MWSNNALMAGYGGQDRRIPILAVNVPPLFDLALGGLALL